MRFRISEFVNTYLAVIGIVCGCVERELSARYGVDEERNIRIALLSINVFITFVNFISIYITYSMALNLRRKKGLASKYDNIWSTGMLPYMAMEYILSLATPNPTYWNLEFEEKQGLSSNPTIVKHRVNDLLLTIMFLRIYTVVRFLLSSTFWMSARAQRVCSMNGCHANMHFALKCMVKQSPILVIVSNLVLSVAVFGYLIRVWDEELNSRWNNPFWLSIITMTSVGYGEMAPVSWPARLIGMITAFWGVYLTSLFVNTLTEFLIMDESQERAYILMNALEEKEAMKVAAVNVLIASYRLRKTKKLHPTSKYRQFYAFKKMRHRMMNFKKQAKYVR